MKEYYDFTNARRGHYSRRMTDIIAGAIGFSIGCIFLFLSSKVVITSGIVGLIMGLLMSSLSLFIMFQAYRMLTAYGRRRLH